MTEPIEKPFAELTDDEKRERYDVAIEIARTMFRDMPRQKEDVKGPIITGELD